MWLPSISRANWLRFCLFSGILILAAWLTKSLWVFVPTSLLLGILVLRGQTHNRTLAQWIQKPSDKGAPDLPGVWETMVTTLYQRNKEQREQTLALTQALQTVRRAAHALPDGVILLNDTLHIEWFNESASKHFPLNINRDIGAGLTQLLRYPELVQYLQDNKNTSSNTNQIPLTLRLSHPQVLILTVLIIEYGSGQYMLISRDVSKLEKLATMRRDFVANVSHELKTPLTVLSGFLDTLREHEIPNSQRQHFFDLMFEQTNRMQQLVNDLLTLAALEHNPTIEESTINMADFLNQVKQDAATLSQNQHQIDMNIQTDANLKGNWRELWSIATNLAQNAVRYTPSNNQHGKIIISWSKDTEGNGVLEISDNGQGIAQQHISRLTERFYRVDNSRTRSSGGTGLGLAIVKHALQRHQATLHIQSELGVGSQFKAVFPAERMMPSTQTSNLTESPKI